jgi:hypothetical protein
MIHVPGMAFDGLVGVSPVQLIKQTIGRALAMERFGAQYFGNGVRPSGAFVYTGGTLDEEARENLRKSLQSSASGANALRPLLLENGLEWKSMTIANNEAQFIESMQQIVAEIARGFGVPLHLIQDLSRSTNNNIEQQAIEFVMYGLRPDAIKWEQELNRKLFAGTEYFCEHSMEGLLRGDFKTRMEGWASLFGTGSVSPNKICETEGWNPIPAEMGGDMHMVPLNMVPLEQLKKQMDNPTPEPADDGGDGTPNDPTESESNDAPEDTLATLRRDRVKSACRNIFKDAVGRTISRAKRDQEVVAKIWKPVIEVAGQLVTLCAVGAKEVPDSTKQFGDTYASLVFERAQGWKQEEIEAITETELNSAYESLNSHVLGGKQ